MELKFFIKVCFVKFYAKIWNERAEISVYLWIKKVRFDIATELSVTALVI